jgi:ADP-heptose:LPS heptosyltransferase
MLAGQPVSTGERVLVIKHGALGDIVQILGAARAIREHHPGARITLLTTPPYAEFMESCPWFDEIWVDRRPTLWRPLALLRLRRKLREAAFGRVYDLQTSERTSGYFRMIGPGPRPQWSGIAPGCSHPQDNPERNNLHTLDRQDDQLRRAGIVSVPLPDLGWAAEILPGFEASRPFVLLVPGGSAHRPDKRWPVAAYAALAGRIAAAGLVPVVIGGTIERPLAGEIRRLCPMAVDLTGLTSFGQIVWLGQTARHAVGNDTGPMHLIAVAGCASTVLFSSASDPALTAPRGRRVIVLRRAVLADLSVEEVAATLELR